MARSSSALMQIGEGITIKCLRVGGSDDGSNRRAKDSPSQHPEGETKGREEGEGEGRTEGEKRQNEDEEQKNNNHVF